MAADLSSVPLAFLESFGVSTSPSLERIAGSLQGENLPAGGFSFFEIGRLNSR